MIQENNKSFPMSFSLFEKKHANGTESSNIITDSSDNIFSSSSQSLAKKSEGEFNPSFKAINGTRSRWTKEEEKTLIHLVSMAGARGWNQIAALLKTKTAKQCRDHYANCLDPEIKNSLWTVEEEHILMVKFQEYGSHWSKIKKFLPGRTTSMIKNYVTMLLKKNEFGLSKQFPSSNSYTYKAHDQNEEISSCSNNNTSSDNDESSFSLNLSSVQEKSIEFNYHDISSLLI